MQFSNIFLLSGRGGSVIVKIPLSLILQQTLMYIDMEENKTPEQVRGDKKTARRRQFRKIRNITIIVVVVGFAAFFAIRFYYPFGKGVKTGELRDMVYKGVIFKTNEGRLIQSGFHTTPEKGVESNEFVFSVVDKVVADTLMRMGGYVVELRYKEYFGALPWRGFSKYIVYEVLSATPSRVSPGSTPPMFEQPQPGVE